MQHAFPLHQNSEVIQQIPECGDIQHFSLSDMLFIYHKFTLVHTICTMHNLLVTKPLDYQE